MARTANVFTRVEPVVKEEAENVLNQLGIFLSTAMEVYLRQIALQRKIPFEIKLPAADKPISYGALTDEDFNVIIDKSVKSCEEGKCVKIEDFKKNFTVSEEL